MKLETKRTDAKAIKQAQDSTEVRMYNDGKPITAIMAATGRNYARVKEILDLAGVRARRLPKIGG